MTTPAHPSYGHLTPEEYQAAKDAPFGEASEFKKKAARRRAAVKAAATRKVNKERKV